ncbi:MAG: succinylglutamate desuccinylase/aspartoacylase family protein [Bacteroidota bacterium]
MDSKTNRTITIGGDTVVPGEDRLLRIPIDRLPTGTLIDIPVYVFNAQNPGPTLLIQAGLHGDEINGIEIVRRSIHEKRFSLQAGAVIAVPTLNVFGFIHFSRDVPDGKDINRSFPGSKRGSLARRIAYHHVTEIMHQMDFAIDLHTGGAQRHNYPQIRYTDKDEKSMQLATIFNPPIAFASGLIKGSFRSMAYRMRKPVVVYEAGESMRFDNFAIAQGMRGIQNVLQHFQMIPQSSKNPVAGRPTLFLEGRKWLRAPTAGIFIPRIIPGGEVKKGQPLGLVTDINGSHTKKIKAPFEGHVICVNHQAVVNQGDALFHLGTSHPTGS